jgi:hypothetical protein
VLIPLVARAGVLAEIGSVLTAARAGRGAQLTATGEPGIGKTRLAEEAARQADGFEVIWTWCPADAGGAALRPWSRVVRVLAGGHTAVARLIADSPFLAALADPARSGDARDPEGARSQLSFDLAEVFAVAAARQPVLVVIDDAHQADVSSLRLLAELAPALRTMPAAVLVTARDGRPDRLPLRRSRRGLHGRGRLLRHARAPAAPVRRDRARRVQPDRPADRDDGRHRQEPRGGPGGRPDGRCLTWLCLTWTGPSCGSSARS